LPDHNLIIFPAHLQSSSSYDIVNIIDPPLYVQRP